MMINKTPAVIIPGDRPASIGIARSLGRRGIKVYAMDSDKNSIALVSKYSTPLTYINNDESDKNITDTKLDALSRLGEKLDQKAVLFPVSDEDVQICSDHRNHLLKYYKFVMPSKRIISNLINKDGLRRIAKEYNIPSPEIYYFKNRDDLLELSNELPYPLIIKPSFSAFWLKDEITSIVDYHPLSNPPKVVLCNDPSELMSNYESIEKIDSRVIIEEVIPGEDNRLFYACFYLDRNSVPLAYFAGQKLRILPVGFGSATYVNSVINAELEEISIKFIKDIGYQGLGGIEFKRDPRDEKLKLIEFNARFGLWDSLSIRCGLDIPYIAYCDALGIPIKPNLQYKQNIKWIDFERDVRAYIIYRSQGKISFSEWIRSYFGERMWSVLSFDDLLPSISSIRGLFSRLFALLKKLR
jgi:D-aspartate ligase